MNIKPFTKGTKIKEYVASKQNVIYTINDGSDLYDKIRNRLMDNEVYISHTIRESRNYPEWVNTYDRDYINTYTFYSGHILKPGVEYKLCFIDNAPLAECALSSDIEKGILNCKYKYLNNIGVFLYRFNPKYSDNMIKEEYIIDSYCVFNLNGEYLAPCKPAPRPLEDIGYLEAIRKNKHSIKKLDKTGILSEEEKNLLFKNNFYDNIYSDYYAFMRFVKSITGEQTTEATIIRIMYSYQIPIINYPINLFFNTIMSILNLPPLEERLNILSTIWEQKKCPIDIPRSLESIATREDETYHFHAEAPITHKSDIKYKVNPSISYTVS